jgi:hypothetical protein
VLALPAEEKEHVSVPALVLAPQAQALAAVGEPKAVGYSPA